MRPQRPAKGRARSTTVERRHRPVAAPHFHSFRAARQGHDQLRGEAHLLGRTRGALGKGLGMAGSGSLVLVVMAGEIKRDEWQG
jgi:hypothetical protein